MKRLRKPAFSSPVPLPAKALHENPSALLEAFYSKVWQEQMHDLPFLNPALTVEAVGFCRIEGDWVGALITPWFLNLFLLPGGGTLWQDLPSGEQRGVAFPAGTLDFIADNNPDPAAPIAAYQYCPLMHPVQHLPDQSTARQAACDALVALMRAPAPETRTGSDANEAQVQAGVISSTTDAQMAKKAVPSPARRAFLGGGIRKL